jgi:hypothetical protein
MTLVVWKPSQLRRASFNLLRLRVNPEDAFSDDGGQIEHRHTTTITAKKCQHKDPDENPTAEPYDVLDNLSRVEDGPASGAEQSVRPSLWLRLKIEIHATTGV